MEKVARRIAGCAPNVVCTPILPLENAHTGRRVAERTFGGEDGQKSDYHLGVAILFSNNVDIERQTDHFILHFRTHGDEGAPIASVAIPLISGIDLTLKMFEMMVMSMADTFLHMQGLQGRIDGINKTVAEASVRMAAAKK